MTELQTPADVVTEPVQLRLPADPTMSRVLRLAASGLASLHDFTIDEVDSIRIAVSEVLIVLVENGAGRPVEIELHADAHGFHIEASSEVPNFDPDHADLRLCRTVLDGVCATHEIGVDADTVRIRADVTRGR